MVSVKVMAFAGVATVMASAANAADMPQLLPPMPVPYYEDFARGWYLRGDIGMSNQRVDSLFNVLYNTTNRVDTVFKEFDSAPIFGIGFGYQFNNWVRFDVTGEYRGGASFHGLDIVESGGTQNDVIKSHHNVGGLPDDMTFELVEPLRHLFKDEVRNIGEQLGLPERIVRRQPFPGPGIAVRIRALIPSRMPSTTAA